MNCNYVKKLIAMGTSATLVASLTAGCGPATDPAPTQPSSASAAPDVQVLTPAVAKQPNIVYIVLDDMGFSDLSCYGSTVNTPNMDALAKSGIQYTNFFTTPLSSPSRAALLTGCEPNSVGMGTTSDIDLGETVPSLHARVNEDNAMISEILQQNNYNTFALGKWHLAPYDEFLPDGDKSFWPSGRGFDKNYGFIASQTSQFEPGSMIEGNSYVDVDFSKSDYHLTNDLVDTTLEYVSDATKQDASKPSFVYFAPGAMHAPLQAPQSYIDQFKGKFDKGWDVERETRFAKQKELGIFPADAVLPERNPGVPAWDELSADEKKIAAKHMEVYAGFLAHTDEQIGRLIQGYKDMGIYDDTIFMLMADNGTNPHGGTTGNPNGHAIENTYYRSVEQQLAVLDELGGKQYGSGYNTGWAMASNTPFKMYKFNTQYGGVRTPMIMSWKNGIKDAGRVSNQLVDVTDITPTMLDVLNIEVPAELGGVKLQPMHGVTFAPVLESAEPMANGRKDIYIHMGPDRAITTGDGFMAATKPGTAQWELYDMEKDPTQAKDIATENPEVVKKLHEEHSRLMKEKYNSQNMVIDILQGVKPEVLIQRYGKVAQSVLETITTGKAPIPEAADIVRILQVSAIDNNRGTILYIPETSKLYGSEFTYDPAMGFFSSLAGARTNAVSHQITIPVERTAGQEGVLFANGGGYDGGYSFYIKDNQLHYVYNFTGERQKLTASVPAPEGKFEVSFKYDKTNLFEGNATLLIDGNSVAEQKIRTLPMFTSYDYMSFGEDVGSKVSSDYTDNFKFAGKLGSITVKLGDDKTSKNERPEL